MTRRWRIDGEALLIWGLCWFVGGVVPFLLVASLTSRGYFWWLDGVALGVWLGPLAVPAAVYGVYHAGTHWRWPVRRHSEPVIEDLRKRERV